MRIRDIAETTIRSETKVEKCAGDLSVPEYAVSVRLDGPFEGLIDGLGLLARFYDINCHHVRPPMAECVLTDEECPLPYGCCLVRIEPIAGFEARTLFRIEYGLPSRMKRRALHRLMITEKTRTAANTRMQ